jgi:hypothetical protein
MARDDSSTRNRYGRGSRGGRQQQVPYNQQGNWQDRYSYGGSRREFESESPPYRPSWPEQRGSFGEREYGQGEQRGYEDPRQRGEYREGARGWTEWPEERMGLPNSLQPYWAPSQWGGGVGMGDMIGRTGYDYFYERENAPPEYYDEPRQRGGYRPQSGPAQYGTYHDYGHQGQQGHAGRGPKGYKRSDDRIHEEICERLTRDPRIDATEIEIKVKNGEVTLTGTVYERRFKHMAEDAADSVSGVKDVHNQIKVDKNNPGFSEELTREGRTANGRDREEEAESTRSGRNR